MSDIQLFRNPEFGEVRTLEENDIEHSLIEPALVVTEQLCGRIYIPYSIEKICEVDED